MSGTTNVPGVCVLIRKNGRALFILRANTGWKDNEYAVPSGHVEDDETFKQAAARETLEEVGLHVLAKDLKYKATIHRKSVDSIRIDVWFEAVAWTGEPKNMEPDKHSKVEWLDLDNLPANTIDYIRFGIECINAGVSYGEIGWNTTQSSQK